MALTGTPGTGKSTVARALASRWLCVEVSGLAAGLGAARPARSGLEVDLDRLGRLLARPDAYAGARVVVGHLAHLLPVRRAIVLRCRPVELARRLARARRGRPADRRANFVSEALDGILAEALKAGLAVQEVDTTGRTVRDVAHEVDRRLRRAGRTRPGRVDWLADPTVTAQLLERAA